MFKILFWFLILLYTNPLFSQNKSDTVFLKKENYGRVYITHDTSRNEYKWLVPEEINNDSRYIYESNFSNIFKDTSAHVTHFASGNLQRKWCPLFLKDEKYYVYSPSDWLFHNAYIITDSTIINYSGEGPYPMLLSDFKVVSDKEYFASGMYYPEMPFDIHIKMIDTKKQIALWDFIYGNQHSYQLMVAVEHIKDFPMVVCDCYEVKCFIEYEFDWIDGPLVESMGW